MKASEIKESVELIPTPIPLLNELCGGIPTRVITEIAGPWSVGKSTLALQIIAQAQRMGRPCYYADSERTQGFVNFANSLGVDCAELEYDKQDYAELLLDNLIEWANKHKNGVIVVDSVGALMGRDEAEKTMEQKSIGIQSKMIASFVRRLTPIIDTKNHALIMVNHIYTDPQYGRIQSSGGAKFAYAKGLAIWIKEAFGHPPKRSADGTKTIKTIEVEIKKAKINDAQEGKKALIELVPRQGFVGEFVAAPIKKKPGRPAKLPA